MVSMTRRATRPPRLWLPTGLLLVALMAFWGCSRPFVSALAPPPYRDQVPASFDTTWHALVRALAAENVAIRVLAKDSGVVASDDFPSPIGLYADCGRLGDVPLEGEALVAFTVFLRPNGKEASDIQVNSKMSTRRYRRGDSGGFRSKPVYPCVSTGRWEADLMDALRHLVKE